jgi:site-specific recombinase XerC
VRRLARRRARAPRGFAAALARRGLAARSRARALVATRRLLRFAGATEAFAPIRVRGVASPRVDRTLPRVLRRDETAALIEAAGQGEGPLALRDRAMLEVLYGAGLRVSELVGCRARALDRRGGWLRVSARAASSAWCRSASPRSRRWRATSRRAGPCSRAARARARGAVPDPARRAR